MRHVIRSYNDNVKPSKLTEQSTIDKLQNMIDTQSFLFSESIYRDSYYSSTICGEGRKSKIIDKLNVYYKYKCGYCESIEALDVEHYRPKGRIDDIDNTQLHTPGYYWLAYEWSNLLPACNKCNREGGKHNKFPYLNTGIRVASAPLDNERKLILDKCLITDTDLINEHPVLLNPEIENNFLEYFKFKVDDEFIGIEIEGIDTNNRGENTIVICNLNRESLRVNRYQSVIKPLVKSIESTFAKYQAGQINSIKLKEEINQHFNKLSININDDELPYTLLYKYVFSSSDRFNEIVLPFLAESIREIVQHAFETYLTQM